MIVHDETRESLSERLSALHRPLPARLAAMVDNAAAVADIAPAPARPRSHRRHRARRRLAQLGSVAAMVGANAGALYYAPVYGDTLRHVPGLGNLIQYSGLAAQDFSVIDVSTEHDGVRLHVAAGYADENQTVLVLDYSGPATGSLPKAFDDMRLRDQFGHDYTPHEFGWGAKQLPDGRVDGVIPGFATFSPISGAAATVGARLTLEAYRSGHPHPSWSLDFVLERRSAEHVSLLGGRIPGVAYTFSRLTITPGAGSGGKALVELDWSARGAAVRSTLQKDEADSRPGATPQPGDNPFAFAPSIVDSKGHEMTLVPAFGFSSDASGDTVWGHYSYVLGPGTYRVLVDGSASGGGFTRTFSVG